MLTSKDPNPTCGDEKPNDEDDAGIDVSDVDWGTSSIRSCKLILGW